MLKTKRIRKVTFLFIYIEFLDILTTLIGINMGLWESNPLASSSLGQFILLKLLFTILIVIVLEKKKPYPHDVLIPIFAVIPVIWNSFLFVLRAVYP